MDSPPPPSRPLRHTIRDVARAAAVSVGTVSLGLADHPSVAEETKAHVRAIAAQLNYVPSAVGRGLRTRHMNAIGLIIPQSGGHVFSHLYFMDVLAGVSETLADSAYTLVLSTAPHQGDAATAYLRILRTQQVDGVILASAALGDENIARLQDSPYPFVFIGRYPADATVPAVGVDDIGGARQATAHLIEHGCFPIAHLSGPLEHLSARDRRDGYTQALAAAGVPVQAEYCVAGDYSEESGRVGMGALLALPNPPRSLFAGNDEMALGALNTLRAAGHVPGTGFPVVGFDDVRLAPLLNPPLTTIRQPMQQLGSLAATRLLALLSGAALDPVQTILPTALIIRQSCGCPKEVVPPV